MCLFVFLYYCPWLVLNQLEQINKTDLIWSGCSPFSYVNPLRVIVHIGDLRLAALVDTGADYDAIDKDLSEIQSARSNKAFVAHRSV